MFQFLVLVKQKGFNLLVKCHQWLDENSEFTVGPVPKEVRRLPAGKGESAATAVVEAGVAVESERDERSCDVDGKREEETFLLSRVSYV